MKATKTTMTIYRKVCVAKKITIIVEVLSVDSIPALLLEVSEHIRSEFPNGSLTSCDGDYVEWEIKQEEVMFYHND